MLTVTVNGDDIAEGDETFQVRLEANKDATISDINGVGTILDDD